MKKLIIYNGIGALLILAAITFLSNCATSNVAMNKSGAQLWGENCVRCHNTPSPETFSDVEWDVAVMHMRVRANLTDKEAKKIADFLKTAN
jgi:cytochrome c1